MTSHTKDNVPEDLGRRFLYGVVFPFISTPFVLIYLLPILPGEIFNSLGLGFLVFVPAVMVSGLLLATTFMLVVRIKSRIAQFVLGQGMYILVPVVIPVVFWLMMMIFHRG